MRTVTQLFSRNLYKQVQFTALIITVFLFACEDKSRSNADEIAIPLVSHNIIPLPSSVVYSDGTILIDKNTVIVRSPFFQKALVEIKKSIDEKAEISISEVEQPGNSVYIRFEQSDSIAPEGYRYTISTSGITIYAKAEVGAFYAVQSIKQLIWQNTNTANAGSLSIRVMDVTDSPKYTWRGFHIDVARHFYSKEYILKLIDWLALYKYNKLQIHLTDDQGWRLQIDAFPLLTEIGAYRVFDRFDSACIRKAKDNPIYEIDKRYISYINNKPIYGGYYTKADLKEIVAYAKDRFIDIVPEIDMPGHMSAAIRAYPYLSASGGTGWGNEFSVPLFPAKVEALNFVYKVWDEVLDIFPGEYVHIGADEVDLSSWKKSQLCLTFMKQHGLATVNQMQAWFVDNIESYLEKKGRKVIAWDDVLDNGKVNKNLSIMYWRNWVNDAPSKAASNGNSIFFTRWDLFYLSAPNSEEHLQNLYNFNINTEYSSAVSAKIKGFHACVWTEEIPSEQAFEYYVFPRLQAISELSWSQQTDWLSFQKRFYSHYAFLLENNVNCWRPSFIK